MLWANAIHEVGSYIWGAINPKNRNPCYPMSSGKMHNIHSIALEALFQLSNFRYLTLTQPECMPMIICITFQPAGLCVCHLSYCHCLCEQHRDPYAWIYCLTELNKQHNIHKIVVFQKDSNDSHALCTQSNRSSPPSLLSSFPITEYILHILSLFPWQISELIPMQPNP